MDFKKPLRHTFKRRPFKRTSAERKILQRTFARPFSKKLSQKRLRNFKTYKTRALENSSQHVRQLLPNVITVLGLALGLSSLRFAFFGAWEYALLCILGASILDVLDGRMARLLGSTSDFGAELDSLADFLSYGAAPSLFAYFFALSVWPGVGWAFCLFFTTCSALRLARFNVCRTVPDSSPTKDICFVGVPAPAGSLIALLPAFASLAFDIRYGLPFAFLITLAAGGCLMVSRIPTIALKHFRLSLKTMPFVLLGFVFLLGGFLTQPWLFLTLLTTLYIAFIPFTALWAKRFTPPAAENKADRGTFQKKPTHKNASNTNRRKLGKN